MASVGTQGAHRATREGRFEEAKSAYLKESDAEAALGLSVIAAEGGAYLKAAEHLDEAIRREGESVRADRWRKVADDYRSVDTKGSQTSEGARSPE